MERQDMTTKTDLLQCNNSEVLIRVPRWQVRDVIAALEHAIIDGAKLDDDDYLDTEQYAEGVDLLRMLRDQLDT